jgi:V8-like Glu-specific endopeptidase
MTTRPLSLPATATLAAAVTAVLLTTAVPAAGTPSPGDPGRPLPPVTPQLRAIELVQPATVMVRSDWAADVHLWGATIPVSYTGSCTGFIVDPAGYVVTAGHCTSPQDTREDAIGMAVDWLIDEDIIPAEAYDEVLDEATTTGRNGATVTAPGSSAPPEPELQVQVGGGIASWPAKRDPKGGAGARVLESLPFAKGDVALLKMESANLPVVQLARREEVQVGQEVLVIGYPFRLTEGDTIPLSNRSGQISATDTTGVHGPGNLFYEISADVTEGQSGAPTTNLAGQVVGSASFKIVGESNFIVPAEVIGELLAKHQVRNELGPIDTLYRAALDDYYHGYYTDAVAKLDQVLATMPAHHLAAEKRKQAVDYRQRHGDQAKPLPAAAPQNRYSLLLLGGAAAMVLLVVVVSVLLLLRRRRAGRHREPGVFDGSPATAVLPAARRPEDHAETVVIGRVVVPDRPRCRSCGSAYGIGAVFCATCGNRIQDQDSTDPGADDVTSAPAR